MGVRWGGYWWEVGIPKTSSSGWERYCLPLLLQPIPAVTLTSACLPGETTVSVQTLCSTSHTRAKWQRGHCFPQSREAQTCPPICVPLPLPQSHQEVLGKRGILCFPGQSPPYVDGAGRRVKDSALKTSRTAAEEETETRRQGRARTEPSDTLFLH